MLGPERRVFWVFLHYFRFLLSYDAFLLQLEARVFDRQMTHGERDPQRRVAFVI